MTTTRLFSTTTALFAGMLVAAPIWAQSGTMQGSVTMVQDSSETNELPGGRSLRRTQVKGIIVADDPNALWHLASTDCRATYIFTAGGNMEVARSFCDVVDADGDVAWLSALLTSDENPVQLLGGTGKYEDIEGNGVVDIQVRFPDGRFAFRFDLTYEMR